MNRIDKEEIFCFSGRKAEGILKKKNPDTFAIMPQPKGTVPVAQRMLTKGHALSRFHQESEKKVS